MLEIRTLTTPGLGDNTFVASYDGMGFVVDPQRDTDRFVDVLGATGVELRYVLETHMHNDYVSGGLALAQRVGAELVLPAGSGAAFPFSPAFHLEDLTVGDLTIRPLHTPGHTPEHISYLFSIDGAPQAVFSGGSLLVGAAGRTDLLGMDRAESLGLLQHASIHRLAALGDRVGLYPTHGSGSFCTASEAGPATSTIGAERASNPVLSFAEPAEFVRHQLAGLQPYPSYYAFMGPINVAGPPPLPDRTVPRLSTGDVREAMEAGVEVVDCRPKQAFAEAHIPRTWGIELGSDFATWVGWLLPFGKPLILIVEDDPAEREALTALARIGFDQVSGVIVGLDDWVAAGHSVVSHGTVTARQFLGLVDADTQVLDVRAPNEWETGHREGSLHVYLPDLVHELPPQIDPERAVYVGCSTGHRASTAAGVLRDAGYDPVVMVGASLLGVIMLEEQAAAEAGVAGG